MMMRLFNSYLFYPKNPEAVIVDSDIIAKAPVKFLVAGNGGCSWYIF